MSIFYQIVSQLLRRYSLFQNIYFFMLMICNENNEFNPPRKTEFFSSDTVLLLMDVSLSGRVISQQQLGCHFSLIPNWLIFFFIFHLIALMFDFTAWNSRESSVRSRTLTPCNFGCCLLQLVRCCSSWRALHFCCRAQHERSKRSAAKFTENDRGIQRHLHAFGGQRLVGSSCTQQMRDRAL